MGEKTTSKRRFPKKLGGRKHAAEFQPEWAHKASIESEKHFTKHSVFVRRYMYTYASTSPDFSLSVLKLVIGVIECELHK